MCICIYIYIYRVIDMYKYKHNSCFQIRIIRRYVYIHTYIYIYMYMCVYIHIYIYIYVCICIYSHIHTYIYTLPISRIRMICRHGHNSHYASIVKEANIWWDLAQQKPSISRAYTIVKQCFHYLLSQHWTANIMHSPSDPTPQTQPGRRTCLWPTTRGNTTPFPFY